MQAGLQLDRSLAEDDQATLRAWCRLRGADLFLRVLRDRRGEKDEDLRRQVLVNCEDGKRDVRWKMAARETLTELIDAIEEMKR